MKKMTASLMCILLVFSMALTMSGCGNDEKKILGTWESKVDCSEWFMKRFTEGLEAGNEGEKMAKYFQIDSFEMTLYLTFNEDGTYAMGVREETVRTAMEGIKDDIEKGLENYLIDELKPIFGEEIGAEDVGEFIEPLMEKAFGEETMESLMQNVQKSTTEGHYKLEDDKICMSKDLEEEIGTDHDTYKLSGNTLTLLECFCEMDNEDAAQWMRELYPLEFTKVD